MDTHIKNSSFKRHDNIDCLRAISCFAIIAMHIQANTNYEISGFIYNTIVPSWTWLVYLFLIISGFSMCCGYYDQTGTVDIEQFYLKRFRKTVPFFACLIFLAVIMEHTIDAVFEGVMELTMAYGLLPNNNPGILGVCWTLGVIFVFYMLFPYFVFLIKNKKRAWMTLIITLVINQMCTLYFFTEKFVVSSFTPRHSFLFCAPFFVVGGGLYLYREEIEGLVSKYRCAMLGTCVLGTVVWYVCPRSVFGIQLFTIESIILFAMWLSYAISVKSRFMNNKIMHYFGSISMEMYLAQMVVFRVIEKLDLLYKFRNDWVAFLFVCTIEIGLLVVGIETYKSIKHFLVNSTKNK